MDRRVAKAFGIVNAPLAAKGVVMADDVLFEPRKRRTAPADIEATTVGAGASAGAGAGTSTGAGETGGGGRGSSAYPQAEPHAPAAAAAAAAAAAPARGEDTADIQFFEKDGGPRVRALKVLFKTQAQKVRQVLLAFADLFPRGASVSRQFAIRSLMLDLETIPDSDLVQHAGPYMGDFMHSVWQTLGRLNSNSRKAADSAKHAQLKLSLSMRVGWTYVAPPAPAHAKPTGRRQPKQTPKRRVALPMPTAKKNKLDEAARAILEAGDEGDDGDDGTAAATATDNIEIADLPVNDYSANLREFKERGWTVVPVLTSTMALAVHNFLALSLLMHPELALNHDTKHPVPPQLGEDIEKVPITPTNSAMKALLAAMPGVHLAKAAPRTPVPASELVVPQDRARVHDRLHARRYEEFAFHTAVAADPLYSGALKGMVQKPRGTLLARRVETHDTPPVKGTGIYTPGASWLVKVGSFPRFSDEIRGPPAGELNHSSAFHDWFARWMREAMLAETYQFLRTYADASIADRDSPIPPRSGMSRKIRVLAESPMARSHRDKYGSGPTVSTGRLNDAESPFRPEIVRTVLALQEPERPESGGLTIGVPISFTFYPGSHLWDKGPDPTPTSTRLKKLISDNRAEPWQVVLMPGEMLIYHDGLVRTHTNQWLTPPQDFKEFTGAMCATAIRQSYMLSVTPRGDTDPTLTPHHAEQLRAAMATFAPIPGPHGHPPQLSVRVTDPANLAAQVPVPALSKVAVAEEGPPVVSAVALARADGGIHVCPSLEDLGWGSLLRKYSGPEARLLTEYFDPETMQYLRSFLWPTTILDALL